MKHSWFFRWWWIRRLLKLQSSPFKLKNETDSLRATCITEILILIQPLLLNCERLLYKIGIKELQNTRSRITRKKGEKEILAPNPLFAQHEISKLVRVYWQNVFAIVFLILAESFLYYLVASLFVPASSFWIKWIVAIFLAVISMLCINYGFKYHFGYYSAVDEFNNRKITPNKLKQNRDLRFIGYGLLIVSFAAIAFAGFARTEFLEFVPAKGLSTERLQSVENASKWASRITFAVTILAAFFLALMKLKQSKVAPRYDLYRYWDTAIRRRNDYNQALIRDASKMHLIAEQKVQQFWQLTIDLKRIFKPVDEVDEKYANHQSEYIQLKAEPGFVLTEALYRKYAPIQCGHPELFAFGVLKVDEVGEKLAFASSVLEMARSKEHATRNTIVESFESASNGAADKNFLHLLKQST